MLEFIEITGMKKAGNSKRNRKFCKVKCSYCGEVKEMRYDTYKTSKSCGCLRAIKAQKTALSLRTHQKSGTPLYRVWQGMKSRCYYPRNKRFDRYGGRGIGICEEWRDDFEVFYRWAVDSGYENGLTIDRIDNDNDYSPTNCRWATSKIQSRNRSSNIIVHHEDKEMTLVQLSEKTGIPYGTIKARYDREGDSDLLTRPLNASTGKKRGENNNKAKITEEIAREIKIRLAKGESGPSIAKIFNINKHIVYDIKRGRTWKHV